MNDDQPTSTGVNPYAMTEDIVTDMFPVEKEPRIPTMDKPLIIESACPGWHLEI